MRIAFAVAALALLLVLPGREANAASALPEGTYLSLDDARLIDEGHIVPILEYVEIGRMQDGTPSLQTGYLHLFPDPMGLLLTLAYETDAAAKRDPAAAVALGALDLAGMRRIALKAEAKIGEGRLAWTASDAVMTTHEPGRLAPADEPRPSPFLRATAAAEDGGGKPSLAFAVAGDVLSVTGPQGGTHRYRRETPMIARMIGFLGRDQDVSIARSLQCLRPIAEPLAAGRTYAFSAAAREAARAAAEKDGPAAAEAWRMLEAKGPGEALALYFAAMVQAQQEAGRLLHGIIERDGLDAVLARFADPASALDRDENWALLLIERFHYFGPQAGAAAPAVGDLDAVLAPAQARYEADPWSIASAGLMQMIDRDGWVRQLRRLLGEEIARLCPAQR